MAKPTINGREVSADEFKRYWTEVFQNDPVLQQLHEDSLAKQKDPSRVTSFNWRDPNQAAAQARIKELGFNPPNDDWSLSSSKSGYSANQQGFVDRNQNWIMPALYAPAAIAGGAALAGAGAAVTPTLGGVSSTVPTFSGGITSLGAAPAIGGTAAVAGTAPALGTAAAAGAGGAASGAGGAAAGIVGPAISSKDFWGKALFGMGGDLLNGYLGNRSVNKAADELIKSGDQQIAAYDKALGPYMDPAPLNALKFLSGLPAGGAPVQGSTTGTAVPGQMAPTTGRTAPPNVPSLGTAVPRGTLASLVPAAARSQAQQQTASSFVRMVSPDGEEGDVHPSQVQAAQAAGARPLAMGRG